MALTKTTLINIQELYDEFEWTFEDEAQHLLDAEGEQVEVLCEATDGYWDIRLANGTKPHGKQRFRVAVNSYTLASGGGRFRAVARLAESPNTRMEITKVDTRTAVADYIARKSPLDIHADPQAVVVLKECK